MIAMGTCPNRRGETMTMTMNELKILALVVSVVFGVALVKRFTRLMILDRQFLHGLILGGITYFYFGNMMVGGMEYVVYGISG
jgi:hypothetical protein